MKVALIQSPAVMGDVRKNYEIASKLIRKASDSNAEIFVFPEMSLTGYFDNSEQVKKSIEVDNSYVKKMIDLSVGNKMIIFGISEAREVDRYITQLVAYNGVLIGKYEKHNLAGDETKNYKKGTKTPVFKMGNIKFGITICADIDLEALYKKYKENGCNIIFECASPDLWGHSKKRDWEKGYNWWKRNCIEKIGKYSKENEIRIAVTTMSGRNDYGDFPGGGYLFSENGKIIAETKDQNDELLIIEI